MSNDPRPTERPGRRYETTFTEYGAAELLGLVTESRATTRRRDEAVRRHGWNSPEHKAAEKADDDALRAVDEWIRQRIRRVDAPSVAAEVTVLAEVKS